MKNSFCLIMVLLFSVLFSLNVSADESMEKQIKGDWYICYPNTSYITFYSFKDDGKVTESHINEDGSEYFSTERFTYEVGENTINFVSIGMDGSADHYYVIDVGEYAIEFVEGNLHLVYMGDSENYIEWFLYPTEELAVEYSDTKEYNANDVYSYSRLGDYDDYLTGEKDVMRRNSIYLIIMSAVCVMAVSLYGIYKIKHAVKQRK